MIKIVKHTDSSFIEGDWCDTRRTLDVFIFGIKIKSFIWTLTYNTKDTKNKIGF